MKKKYQVITVATICLFLIGFFLSIYVTVEEELPANAVVVITLEDKLYHSIHFDFISVSGKTEKTTTLDESLTQGYKRSPHDENLGYFRGNRRFLFHHLLSKLGLPVNSGWDRFGNWFL